MNLSNPNLKLKGGKYFFNHIILKQIKETPFKQIEKDCLLSELKLFIYLLWVDIWSTLQGITTD